MKIKKMTHLEHPKHRFTPTCFKKFPITIRIKKPYKIDTTDVPPMITVANPLHKIQGTYKSCTSFEMSFLAKVIENMSRSIQ